MQTPEKERNENDKIKTSGLGSCPLFILHTTRVREPAEKPPSPASLDVERDANIHGGELVDEVDEDVRNRDWRHRLGAAAVAADDLAAAGLEERSADGQREYDASEIGSETIFSRFSCDMINASLIIDPNNFIVRVGRRVMIRTIRYFWCFDLPSHL